MYNFFPYIMSVIFLLLGIYMITNPKSATNKDFRNDPKQIAKARRNGFIMVLLSIIIFFVGICMPK